MSQRKNKAVAEDGQLLILDRKVGDKVEVGREGIERGSCSLMCTFGWYVAIAASAIKDEIRGRSRDPKVASEVWLCWLVMDLW